MGIFLDMLAGRDGDLAECMVYALEKIGKKSRMDTAAIDIFREEKALEIVKKQASAPNSTFFSCPNSIVIFGYGNTVGTMSTKNQSHNYQLVAKNDVLRQQKDELHTECVNLRQQLCVAVSDSAMHQQRNAQLEIELGETCSEVSELRGQNQVLREQNAALRGKIDVLGLDRTKALRERDEARGRNATLCGKIDVLSSDHTKALRERDESRRDATTWRDRLFQGWHP
eukprot:scaffold6351_cov166-Amphora_coffeaeformis.AAC.10